jgi:alkyl hydroperoxide reductase subunit AhpC
LVLIFYPLAFTYVCPTEILSFNDRIVDFVSVGADVVACSVDSPHATLAW